jgi:hypothetical protein
MKQSLLTTKTISCALLITIFTGCASLPFVERQANATTQVSERWSRDQTERITATIKALSKSENGGAVEWSVDSSEQGNGDQSLLGGIEKSIPGGIKLIALAAGCFLMLFFIRTLINSSNSGKAMAQGFDNALSKHIRELQGRFEASKSGDEKLSIMSMIKNLEVERGKTLKS